MPTSTPHPPLSPRGEGETSLPLPGGERVRVRGESTGGNPLGARNLEPGRLPRPLSGARNDWRLVGPLRDAQPDHAAASSDRAAPHKSRSTTTATPHSPYASG